MLFRLWPFAALLWLFAPLPASSQPDRVSTIPHMERRGDTTQLIVDGKPLLALEYMKPVCPRLAAAHLNTVLVPISWALLEPGETAFATKASPHAGVGGAGGFAGLAG